MDFLVSKDLYPSLRRNLEKAWQDVLTHQNDGYFSALHKFKGICCYVKDETLNKVVDTLTEQARTQQKPTAAALNELDRKIQAVLEALK